jgi:hypothetical protein
VSGSAVEVPAAAAWYCPACGRRYSVPGTCGVGHPAESLHTVADTTPADPAVAESAQPVVVSDETEAIPADPQPAAGKVAPVEASSPSPLQAAVQALHDAAGSVSAAIAALEQHLGG